MSKFKIINLIDKIFITVSIFLIVYAWINFYVRNLWPTFILSLVFSFAITYLIFYIFNKKTEKKHSTKKYLFEVEEKFLAFHMLDEFNKYKLLEIILSKEYPTSFSNSVLIFEKENLKQQILFFFNSSELTQFDLVNLIQKRHNGVDVLNIVCNNFNNNIDSKILKDLKINFITKTDLYDDYFFKAKLFPDCSNLNTQKEKLKFKNVLRNIIIPSKSKSYFLCGLVLIFSAIILPFHIYYLVFGSTFLLLAILCKLSPFFKR